MTVEKKIKEEEMRAIEKLRERFEGDIEPELEEDIYFLRRFLEARDYDIDETEALLRKHLEWRRKNDVKTILETYKKPEVFEKYMSYQIIGCDKEGSIIRYMPTGNIDFSGLLSSMRPKDVVNIIIYEQELDVAELKKKSEEMGKIIENVIYIADVGNLSFALVTDKKVIQNLILLLQLYVNNYPEMLKAAFFINASFYFSIVYSLMKTVVPAKVLEKVRVYFDDSYKEDLLKLIDADELPAFLGGNKTDPDGNPLCKTFINHGGEKVPETYYISKNKVPLSKTKGVQKVTLSRAAFHEVYLEVKEPGSYLEWEFETKCRDIGFGVFYQELIDGEEKITELVPIERIDTEEYPETGTFFCEKAGTYVIVFDNTYSWIRAKEIYYKAKIVSPKEQEAELEGS